MPRLSSKHIPDTPEYLPLPPPPGLLGKECSFKLTVQYSQKHCHGLDIRTEPHYSTNCSFFFQLYSILFYLLEMFHLKFIEEIRNVTKNVDNVIPFRLNSSLSLSKFAGVLYLESEACLTLRDGITTSLITKLRAENYSSDSCLDKKKNENFVQCDSRTAGFDRVALRN